MSEYTPQDLQDNLNYLDETKQLIKQAIIDKGQSISEEDTFRSYVDKIEAIETGIDTSDATATSNDLIAPKTAYVNGEKIEGTMHMTEQVVTDPVVYNNLYSVPNTDNINNTSLAVAPDGTIVTISNGTIRVFQFGTNNYISYSLSSFGISNTQNIKVDINQSINEYGAYLVIFESDYSHYGTGTLYIACTYLKNGQLGYRYNSNQAHHLAWTESCSWWNTALCHSNTKPLTFFVPTRNDIRVCTVNINLTEHSTKSIGVSSARCLSAQITSDDHFIAVNCENSWDGTKQTIARLDSDFNLLSVQKYTCNSDIVLVHKNGENYCIMRDYFYHLIESQTDGSFNMVQQAGRVTNLLDSGSGETSSRPSYKYGMFTEDNILAVSGGTSGQIVFFTYVITEQHQITVQRLNNYSYSGGDTRRIYPYKQYMIYIPNTSQVGSYNVLSSGELIPITISRKDSLLFNTYDAETNASQVLLNNIVYTKTGKVTGTMPNNGNLNVVPTEEVQSFPAGYYSSISVNSDRFEDHTEYQECLTISEEILS